MTSGTVVFWLGKGRPVRGAHRVGGIAHHRCFAGFRFGSYPADPGLSLTNKAIQSRLKFNSELRRQCFVWHVEVGHAFVVLLAERRDFNERTLNDGAQPVAQIHSGRPRELGDGRHLEADRQDTCVPLPTDSSQVSRWPMA